MKNKNLTIAIISVIIIALSFVVFYKLFNEDSSHVGVDDEIVANYEGGVVTSLQAQAELNKVILKNPNLKGLTFNDLNADQKEMVVKEIVIKEIAYKEAKKQDLDESDEYKQALKLFESEVLKQKLFLKLVEDAKKEENLKQNYDKLAKELKNKKDIRISYISVKTENEANSLHKILTKYPGSFASQAKKKSLDKEIGKKGGDLGFVLEDALPAEIVKQVKLLEKGKISEPFKLADKWVVIKLEDERPAVVAKFEEVKEALAQSLSMKALQDFISKSVKEANIKIIVK